MPLTGPTSLVNFAITDIQPDGFNDSLVDIEPLSVDQGMAPVTTELANISRQLVTWVAAPGCTWANIRLAGTALLNTSQMSCPVHFAIRRVRNGHTLEDNSACDRRLETIDASNRHCATQFARRVRVRDDHSIVIIKESQVPTNSFHTC